MPPLSTGQKITLAAVLAAVFFLAYSPHFLYRFPYHVDEWHHIQEALRLGDPAAGAGGMPGSRFRFSGSELGFQCFLYLLSFAFDLVKAYQYLPGLWAAFSAAALFWVVRRRTGGDFAVALYAAVFFASIKTNVNLLGPWFFTPLTFAIPLVFAYMHFFERGVDEQNGRYLAAALAAMAALIVIHPPSILFGLPILALYLAFRWKTVARYPRAAAGFLSVPCLGLLAYKFGMGVSFAELAPRFAKDLVFPLGWGVLEARNSIFEVYSPVPLALAALGAFALLRNRAVARQHLIHILWPVTTLFFVAVFRITGYSFFSPYQRYFFYLALSLPFLSAVGLSYLLGFLGRWKGRYATVPALALAVVLAFLPYYQAPRTSELYRLIDESDYAALSFLKALPPGRVMAPLGPSMAAYPVSRHEAVAGLAFYGNPRIVQGFFAADSCAARNRILAGQKARYVLSPAAIDCGWTLARREGGNYLYSVQP